MTKHENLKFLEKGEEFIEKKEKKILQSMKFFRLCMCVNTYREPYLT